MSQAPSARLHSRSVLAIARSRGEQIDLIAPSPGLFRTHLRAADVIRPGTQLGELEVLGQLIAVVAPDTARGAIVSTDRDLARAPVDQGTTLFTLDPRASSTASASIDPTASASSTGLVFRAPTSGRFYVRPSPDKPPFVAVGTELAANATICLLEVMKTFHRVTYGGAGLPDRARVREVLVVDGADVNAGDPLLALDPL